MEQDFYFLTREHSPSAVPFVVFTISIFLIVWLRYLVFANVYRWVVKTVALKSIHSSSTKLRQCRKEIKWAAMSSLVFAVLTSLTFIAWQHGYTRIHVQFETYSTGYFLFSIMILLVSYETYYYWLHRWMHRPRNYRIIHRVHHDSLHTTVFTSFSFHPLEAFLQFIFLPIFVVIVPVHYLSILIVLLVMTLSAIVNHGGTEIFPRNFNTHRMGRWLIGATHHDLHHKEFKTNYGLYFTFWDKWMKTENKNYDEAFVKNKE